MSKLTNEIETRNRWIQSPDANRSRVVANQHNKLGTMSPKMRLNRIEMDRR